LLERVRFLGILVSNFDEFEMVRIPRIAQESTPEHFGRIRTRIVECMRAVRRYLRESIVPALAREGIHLIEYNGLTASERAAVDAHFTESVLPVLMPLASTPSAPFLVFRT
jgi:polyphosphate kinase